MAPDKMNAIKVVGAGQAELQQVPLPKLRDDYVLVRVTDVALNPTDWKHIHFEPMATSGCTVGCDFAGIVEQVGSKVTKQWTPGERIAGFCHGVNKSEPEDGAFAQYCVVKGDAAIKIPSNMDEKMAATLGVGVMTVGQALYQSLKLPFPGEGSANGMPLLIYGGSTATGSLAIQFAKLTGCDVITTCSPHNFDFVHSLGAKPFSYHDADCADKIREYTKDNLTHVFDCISEGASPNLCANAISSTKGGVISYLLPAKHDRKDVENRHTLGYTFTGEEFKYGPKVFEAKPEDFEFAKKFIPVAERLLAESKIKVHPAEKRDGGLKGVFEGLDMLKDGKVSGKKLVYSIADTPGL